MTECSRDGCNEGAAVKVTYGDGRTELFCARDAEAKADRAEARGIYLKTDPLSNYKSDH